MNTYPDVASYIDALKKLLLVRSDQQLAEKVGVSKQAISAWRQRNNLPYSVEAKLTDKYGRDAAYRDLERSSVDKREDIVVYALFHVIRTKYQSMLPKAVGPAAEISWGEVMWHSEHDLRQMIRQIGFANLSREEVYTVLARRIEDGTFETALRGADVYIRADFHPEIEPYTEDDLEPMFTDAEMESLRQNDD